MPRALSEIKAEIAAKTREMAPLIEKVVNGQASGDEYKDFEARKGQIEQLKAEESDAQRNESLRGDAEEMRRLADEYNKPVGSVSGMRAREGATQGETTFRSIGEAFANSEQLKEFRGRLGAGSNSRAFRVGSVFPENRQESLRRDDLDPEVRALITSTTVSVGIEPDRRPEIIMPDQRELPVRALFPNGTTDSNSVEFVKMGAFTNNAAEVADPTSLTTGLKPESGFTLTEDVAPVVTIAHLMYAHRNALQDMGQLTMLINQFLLRGLDERIDRQLLLGNGTSPNLRGLLAHTGIQVADAAYWTANPLPADANKWDRLRRAMTMVRLDGRGRTSGMVLSPELLEEASMAKDANGNYLFPAGGPFGTGGFTSLWGVPVTEQEDLAADQAIVGDFARGASVLDRMNSQIFVSDSNRDLFERNIITFLAETRIAFPVYRPEVFVNATIS